MSPCCEANSSLANKLSTFYQTQSFTMFARACHIFLSWARSVQSMCAILFLEMSCSVIHPYMSGYSKWSFLSGFPNKSCAYFISPCMLHTLHMSSFVWFLKQYFVECRDYEPAHNIDFFTPLIPSPFSPRYHSQHPNLKHPQPVFLPFETMMKL
jgi:hypothetical protein